MKPHHYAEIAALVLGAEASFAVIHRVMGGEYAGYSHAYSVFVDVGLAALWLSGAAAAVVRRTAPAFFVVVLGVMASLTYGLMFLVASPGTGAGLPFLVAAAVIAVMLNLSKSAWRMGPTERADGTLAAGLRLPLPSHA